MSGGPISRKKCYVTFEWPLWKMKDKIMNKSRYFNIYSSRDGRKIYTIPRRDMMFLVSLRVKSAKFQLVVQRIQSFISLRLFPPKPDDLPPMSKCTWWIPSATRVLALLSKSAILSFRSRSQSLFSFLVRLIAFFR